MYVYIKAIRAGDCLAMLVEYFHGAGRIYIHTYIFMYVYIYTYIYIYENVGNKGRRLFGYVSRVLSWGWEDARGVHTSKGYGGVCLCMNIYMNINI
jgi:hypothetical protein